MTMALALTDSSLMQWRGEDKRFLELLEGCEREVEEHEPKVQAVE